MQWNIIQPWLDREFFFFKFIFNWRMITLHCCVGFCQTPTWISHRYTYVSTLLKLPPTSHPIPSHPSRLSQSTGLSSLHHTANSNQLSVLHMVMYIFQCYSLNSSHVLPSPLCPQVCSLKETGNSDACYSVEEHWEHYGQWHNPVTKKHAMIPCLWGTERSQLLRNKVEWWFARGSNEGWNCLLLIEIKL